MNDQQRVLAMLERNPDDNETRLVYADWLDDHDQPEEAARCRAWKAAKEWLTDFAAKCGQDCINYDDVVNAECAEYERARRTRTDIQVSAMVPKVYEPITFDTVVKAGHDWLRDGEYNEWRGKKEWDGEYFVQRGSEQARAVMHDDGVQEAFWRNWSIVTGVTVPGDKQGQPFSCTC